MAELDVVPAVDEPSEETFFDEPSAPSVEEPVEEPPEEPPVEEPPVAAPAPKAKAKAKAKPRAKPRAVPKATPPANTPEPVAPHIPSHFDLLPTIDSHLRTWLAAQKSAERQRLADRYAQFRLI